MPIRQGAGRAGNESHTKRPCEIKPRSGRSLFRFPAISVNIETLTQTKSKKSMHIRKRYTC